MGLDRSPSSPPLWAQVEQELRDRIASGKFPHRLPTEMELVDEYGVSRPTIRQAVAGLVADGLVSRTPGRGTEVRSPMIEQSLPGSFSLARAISAAGHRERSEVLVAELSHPPETVAQSLQLGEESSAVRIERLRFIDDSPIAVDRSWLPSSWASPLLDTDLSTGSIYDVLAAHGIRPTGGHEEIEPVLPDDGDRRRLHLPAREPALRIRRALSCGDRPLEDRTSIIRPDRFRLVNRWGDAVTDGE